MRKSRTITCCAVLLTSIAATTAATATPQRSLTMDRELLGKLEATAKTNPGDVMAQVRLGETYRRYRDFERATQVYKTAWEIPGAKPEALYDGYISSLCFSNEYNQAAHVADEYIKKFPLKARAHMQRAIIYGAVKNYPQAEQEFKKALRLFGPGSSPERTETEIELALALYRQKKWSEAVPYLSKNIAADSSGFKVLMARGDCYLHLGKVEEGKADLIKLRTERPRMPQSYEILARYYEDRREYSKAIAVLTIILDRVDRNADRNLLRMRSRLYGLNGQRELALKDRDRLKDINTGLNDLFLPKH